ncbi:MAG TPA: AbrB family transcriptional regulator [Anaerolineae bacterium]|nr:AbrB family transcriptional regulator [Anaerolineae bacterium]
MPTVTVSPKFQIVIPQKVRENLDIRPGQKLHVMTYDGRIELIPVMSVEEAYGFLKGIDTNFQREEGDRT